MPFIDFEELKANLTFEEVVKRLDLAVKRSGNQWRGPCPQCKSGGDRALVVTEGKGYFCFSDKRGGDLIALAAHALGFSMKDAAKFLADGIVHSTLQSTSGTVPESARGKEADRSFTPLSYLEPEHDAVVAVGFDLDFCKRNGIGYAPKGILRGTVAIPFRDEHGNLLGYIGVTEATLPADFTPNVVPFKKTA